MVARLAAWDKKQAAHMETYPVPSQGNARGAAMNAFNEKSRELRKAREKIVRSERTGFVWVIYQK